MLKLAEESICEFSEAMVNNHIAAMEKFQKTQRYQQNQEKINNLKTQLIQEFFVDEVAIDLLIESVIDSVTDEYDYSNGAFATYLAKENESKSGLKKESFEVEYLDEGYLFRFNNGETIIYKGKSFDAEVPVAKAETRSK